MAIDQSKRSRWIPWIGVGLIVVFVLGCIELAATAITTNEWILKNTSELSSTRWYLLWLNQMQRAEIQEVTNYSIDSHHPYLGWSPKKNSRTVLYDGTTVSFNTAGTRGVREYALEKPPNVQRIAVIGDSFSFGEEVNDLETFSAQLEKKLQNTEVMNFAVHGYGIDQMLLRLEQKVLAYKPDIIVFAFIHDDINRGFVSFRDYQKPVFRLSESGQLQLTNTPIPSPDELYKQSQFLPKTVLATQLLTERWRYRNYDSINTAALAHAVFDRVDQLAQAHSSVPVFLFLPAGIEMTDLSTDHTGGERTMFDFCQNTVAICISARPYLIDAYTAGARYDTTRHYTPEIHSIIADGLLNDLKKKQLLQHAP